MEWLHKILLGEFSAVVFLLVVSSSSSVEAWSLTGKHRPADVPSPEQIPGVPADTSRAGSITAEIPGVPADTSGSDSITAEVTLPFETDDDDYVVLTEAPIPTPCFISDETVTVPADIAPQNQSAQVGDTVTWSCTVRNECGTTKGFSATWDMHLSDGTRSCTLDPPLGTNSIQCGHSLDEYPTCEVSSTGNPPAICDSRYSGESRTWIADGVTFFQMTLTIQDVQSSDFQHSYRCARINSGSPGIRSIVVSLRENQ